MRYFARINEENLVKEVIVIADEDCHDSVGNHSEQVGVNFIISIVNRPGNWIETSNAGQFRGHFASVGMVYDETNDRFLYPQPFPSWILDDYEEWISPVPYPDDLGAYEWDEATTAWKPIKS